MTNTVQREKISIFDSTWDISILNKPAPNKNQDAYAIGKNSIIAVDGATPLDTDWPSDIGDYARDIANTFVRFADNSTLSTKQVWRNSFQEINAKYPKSSYKRSAGVMLARRLENRIEFSSLGDLYGCIKFSDSYKFFHNDRISKLDESIDADSVKNQLIVNRMKQNRPDGYWIFSDSDEALNHLDYFESEIDKCVSFLISTDGYFRDKNKDAKKIIDDIEASGFKMPKFSGNRSVIDAPDDVTIIYALRN